MSDYNGVWSNDPHLTCKQYGTLSYYHFKTTISTNITKGIGTVGAPVGTFSYPGLQCHGELLYYSATRSITSGKCEFVLTEQYLDPTGCDTEDTGVILLDTTVDDEDRKMKMLWTQGGKKSNVECDDLRHTPLPSTAEAATTTKRKIIIFL